MIQRIRAARQQRENGFTLTELLIVIVILGVLAGIVVFAVQAFQDRGEEAACDADFKATETAVEAYYAQEGTYPDDWDLLVPNYLRTQPGSPPTYEVLVYTDGTVRATGSCERGPEDATGLTLIGALNP